MRNSGSGDSENPYQAARTRELSVTAKISKEARSWRRIAFALTGGLVISLMLNFVLGVKNQHDVLVYRDDDHGLHVMSEAMNTRTPTRLEIEAQIVHWISALRDVPGGGDYAAVDRDLQNVLAGTQADSHALQTIRAFYTAQNPKVLSANLSRTVHGVGVNAYTANTYSVQWSETLRLGSRTDERRYTGTVTIATPRIPDDPAVGLLNPAGVYVTDYDLPWSNP